MRLVQLFEPDPVRLLPLGIRFGSVVYAPNITGGERGMDDALDRMGAVLAQAGASFDNVARVTAFVPSVEDREPVYGPWDARFPDARDRPAFKVLVAPLASGVRVRLDMLALLGQRRERVDLAGVPARDPTIKIGQWVLTSRVHGTDPTTGKVIDGGLEAEARQALDNVEALVGSAQVAQLSGFVRDPSAAGALAQVAEARPLNVLANFVPPSMRVMLEAMAGQPQVREIFLHAAETVIPDAICIGELFFAPGLVAPDAGDFEAQLRAALTAMQTGLGQAGLTSSQVAHVSVYLADLSLKPTLNQVWTEVFPRLGDRPPHKYVPVDLPDGQLVRLQVFAVRDAARRVLEIPGLVHGDPMSMGALLGGLLFSSRIVGTDTHTGTTPESPEEQARLAFANVRTLLQQAGGSPRDLSQVTAFVNTARDRQAVETAWRALQSESSASADLHFLHANLPGSTSVRLEVMASLESAC